MERSDVSGWVPVTGWTSTPRQTAQFGAVAGCQAAVRTVGCAHQAARVCLTVCMRRWHARVSLGCVVRPLMVEHALQHLRGCVHAPPTSMTPRSIMLTWAAAAAACLLCWAHCSAPLALPRNDDSTAPATHQAAYSLRCHSRTASTVAETVHLVCAHVGFSQRPGCASNAAKLNCTQMLPAERLTDSFTMVKAWMCQGRLAMSVLSLPSVGAASSEDHRGDKGGVLAARLHQETSRWCWRSLNREQFSWGVPAVVYPPSGPAPLHRRGIASLQLCCICCESQQHMRRTSTTV